MGFEQYSRTQTRSRITTPTMTIGITGILHLNVSANDNFGLDGFDYALLFFNEQTREIGIKPTKQPLKEAFKLRHNKKQSQLTASSFLKHYNVDYGKAQRYDIAEKDGMLVAGPVKAIK